MKESDEGVESEILKNENNRMRKDGEEEEER